MVAMKKLDGIRDYIKSEDFDRLIKEIEKTEDGLKLLCLKRDLRSKKKPRARNSNN